MSGGYDPVWDLVRPFVERAQPRGALPRPNSEGWIDGLHSPLYKDSNPSFCVIPDTETNPGGWKDWGTGEKGGMRDLARRLGIEVPAGRSVDTPTVSLELTMEGFCQRRRLDATRLRERWKVREVKHRGRPCLAWMTPVSRELLRVKYLDGEKPKYRWWESGKGGTSHLYCLRSALEHVQNGVVYLVNGEVSVWACDQEGVAAVCVGGGEATAPTTEMIAQLLDAGVKLVRIAYDRDSTGREGAQKAASALREGGLPAVVLELPEKIGPHGDVDDLHRWEGDGLQATLASLREMPASGELVLTNLGDVRAEPVRWLWSGRIARGKLTVMGGDPGCGKSYVSMAITSAVTNGAAMPDNDEEPDGPGEVLLLNYEDGLADTVRPRADLLGVQVRRVTFIEGTLDDTGRQRQFQLQDIPKLDRVLQRQRGIKLLIVDPVLSLMGGDVDAARDNEVRAALHPLTELAARYQVAVLGIMHLRKGEASKALYRIANSVAFGGMARSVLLVAEEADTKRRAVAHIKCNLGQLRDPVEFRVSERGLEWVGVAPELGELQLMAAATGETSSDREEATEFLRECLKDGPRPARQVLEEGKRVGFSEKTLQRARKDVGVKPRRLGGNGSRGAGSWMWELLGAHPLVTEDIDFLHGQAPQVDLVKNGEKPYGLPTVSGQLFNMVNPLFRGSDHVKDDGAEEGVNDEKSQVFSSVLGNGDANLLHGQAPQVDHVKAEPGRASAVCDPTSEELV